MTEVRTRFAPSPTGFLHVGSLRTVLFSWLLAKHHGGKFLLRIEDTDQKRTVPGAIRSLLTDLAWFGIVPDEGPSHDELRQIGEYWDGAPSFESPRGPYIQSLRLARYKEIAEQLIQSGACYRCDCTPEMLEKERLEQMARKEPPGYSGYCRDRNVPADRPHIIRLRMPHKRTLEFYDAVRGRITWESIPLRDPVLLKADGFPTYHLAAMVDDHDMGITHALRGEEWLATTPIHLLVYESLGWERPVFAHLPNVLGPNGKKLSKRDGSTFVSEFRDQGYLPEGLMNFLALIGWSPGDGEEQEVFSREELIERFTLEGVNRAGGVFDYQKLQWMNGEHMRRLSDERFYRDAVAVCEAAGLSVREERLRVIAPYVKERVKLLNEVPPMVEFLFTDQLTRDIPAMFQKGIDAALAARILEDAHGRITALSEFTIESLEQTLRPMAEVFNLKLGPLFGVLRIAVTGKKVTPPLFESFFALGRDTTLRRIEETLALLRTWDDAS